MLALVNYVGLSMYCNIDLPGLIEGFAFLLYISMPGLLKALPSCSVLIAIPIFSLN